MAQALITGGTSNVLANVDPAQRALRTSLSPTDYGIYGSYRKAMTSGTLPATPLVAGRVYAFRWAPTPSTAICLVRRVRISAGDLVGFTAGFTAFNLFMARTYLVLETVGTAGTFTGNNGKLRTSMATSAGASCMISAADVISGGTATLDTDPIATVSTSTVVADGTVQIRNGFDLFSAQPGEQPIVLATSEGFVIEATVPATGTWQIGVEVAWDEVASW